MLVSRNSGSGNSGSSLVAITVDGEIIFKSTGATPISLKQKMKEICDIPIEDVPLLLDTKDEILKDLVSKRLERPDLDFRNHKIQIIKIDNSRGYDPDNDLRGFSSNRDTGPSIDIDFGDGPELML